ncbi:uncharacterized protein LOC118502272 [Phyllostomus discolor]|uniref:Uncharacterized protein LOC118502272 n=1 Tax=Phyllostomus discolor TaxID=89673 RepID=A0A7E6EFX5_9CHIR|nr:uncharacterized protein LOC118502272 [Phyllostomus discolor]
MARAAAGLQRSPRPPSGRGAHGSGADSSQLASASRLSGIHFWALLPKPVRETERSPFGGSGWGAAGRAVRAVRGPQGFSVPTASPAKGSGGGGRRAASRTLEPPLPATGLEPTSYAGPRSARPLGRDRCSPGVWVGPFYPLFQGGGEEARLGGSRGKRRGVVRPRAGPGTVRILTLPKWGAASRALGSWQGSLPGQRSLPVLRPSCSSAEVPANAKVGNCFPGAFTAAAAAPRPGQGALSAIALQTTARLTERSPSSSAQFQQLASTSTSTPGPAPRDIMCQSHGLPENLEQDFPGRRFLLRCVRTSSETQPCRPVPSAASDRTPPLEALRAPRVVEGTLRTWSSTRVRVLKVCLKSPLPPPGARGTAKGIGNQKSSLENNTDQE